MKKFILLILLTLVSMNSYATELKSFAKTCNNFIIYKASLSAVCTAENGARYNTSLRLRGINNSNGVLTADADSHVMSKFHTTCTKTGVDSNGVLAASCKNSKNAYVWTFIDLNPLLRNFNGTLVYPSTYN
ncbi:CVNH domain-containing protein [Fluviispira multicolorata]|uniref:Cyanovirin-N domain-containing protein n=1 Tax=Fluviispira multicolorata TaxID=2654512 RepID=A0A833JF05_9BACT|nr:CVNH domain-containing protein [Fluviispira multicolorata]KAB8030775.1 hypothetical protein GCL57_07320 [Fluviispira multicolorata]